MWICFNDAFVSAVQDDRRPNMLKVRARKREHLETLFPGRKIYKTPKADYAFRVFVTKKAFAKLVARRVLEIDYKNFKDSVVDNDLHNLYFDFWTLHHQYQIKPKRPIGSTISGYGRWWDGLTLPFNPARR